jgi:hypothetical protein
MNTKTGAGIVGVLALFVSDFAQVAKPSTEGVLRSAAAYCRRLEHAILDFACREEVQERLGAVQAKAAIQQDSWPREGETMAWRGGLRTAHEWAYDYLLLRDRGTFRESRILLKEDGKDRRVEGASLATSRFRHGSVVLGPIGLLGEEAQKLHAYRVLKVIKVRAEPAVIIDVRPREKDASSLFGKAWVRVRDGAVLEIEWAPSSMANYPKIEALAEALDARPDIQFASEYAFEKNGLRFPSAYRVVESYRRGGLGKLVMSDTRVEYRDYRFFQVKTEVEY